MKEFVYSDQVASHVNDLANTYNITTDQALEAVRISVEKSKADAIHRIAKGITYGGDCETLSIAETLALFLEEVRCWREEV